MAVQNQRLQQQQQQKQKQQQDNQEPTHSTRTPTKTTTGSPSKLGAATAITTGTSRKFPKNLTTTSTTTTNMPLTTATNTPANMNGTAAGGGGGPRVSFNRDVHVKRIGKRPNELTHYETTNIQPPQNILPAAYHQLPTDLSAESIRKEAALVLAQAERHKSKADGGDNIPTFRVKTKRSGSGGGGGGETNPKKFHSLPTRKKKSPGKPVSRSVSDAAAKKPTKRPSIFSIFSRKSDTNINQVERDPRFDESGGRRLVRSKSDVGSVSKEDRKLKKKDPKPTAATAAAVATNAGSTKQLHSTQLSPIIENAQREDYFAEQFNRERRKSDAITDREKHESGIRELLDCGRLQVELVDSNLIGKSPISNGIKDKIRTLQAQSNDNMHSSQLPAQKLPLTKGVTVNGMVKRLSMERFSPPPTISGPAFSYIRPNEGITYAQLDLSDDQYPQGTLNRRERMFSPPRDYRSPARDMRSPERERERERDLVNTGLNQARKSVDRTDFVTSHSNLRSNYSPSHNHHGGRVVIEPAARTRDSFSPGPVVGPTTIRISSSHSPSPWQQLSPRNLSDEDEGLGFETRKYYHHDDELPKMARKSPTEPPIVPVIRSITPTHENGFETNAYNANRDEPPHDDLGYRRARLESRILTRRFGDSETLERNGYTHNRTHHETRSPERNRDIHEVSTHHRYLSPEREPYEPRFHRPETTEIINKYSPERSHLDMITQPLAAAPAPRTEKTSRYKHTKYYDDGRGGIKEVYERETHQDGEGQPHVRESRHRERLDSYTASPRRDQSSTERQLMTNDYEPKSLDSQFTSTDQYRSSPENMKRYELSVERGMPSYHGQHVLQPGVPHDDHWHSSLKRDKLQQRSFDKGDSGIENDFRKESFNGDITTRWRKRTPADEVDTFLKRERRHTEEQQQQQQQLLAADARRRDDYVYRERSIDDGSHFDPHLDKYPVATSTLVRRKDQQSQTGQGQDTLKRNKKLGGFEKVKQLFTGGGNSSSQVAARDAGGSGSGSGSGSGTGTGTGTGTGSSSSGASKKELDQRHLHASSTLSSNAPTIPPKDRQKDKYMVKEEEMRSRYSEHRGAAHMEASRDPKATDISMRRRLSTPKASPLLLKRTSSDKTRKQKESPLAKPEKTSWFKSLDRRAKSKSKEKLNVTVNGQSETSSSSMKRSKTMRSTAAAAAAAAPPPIPPKNLRFFGDTDLDSNPPTITRAHTTLKSRPGLSSTLNRSQKYSQSAYNLDRIQPSNGGSPQRNDDYRRNLSSSATLPNPTVGGTRHKSTSMQNLKNGTGTAAGGGGDEVDFRKRRHYSRSRDLDDISESGSETEDQHKRPNGVAGGGARTLSRERLDRTHRYDEHAYRRANDRQTPVHPSSSPASASAVNGAGGRGGTNSSSTQMRRSHAQHLMGPPKPARSAERRAISSSYARERDRFPAESSGTEGESSLHSQRSIVYLHATTVGAIPQPYQLRRRAISRDDLRSQKGAKNAPLQPMTRTVSRSVSMLAPWKPKLASEGYEINYSQEQNKRMSTLPRKPGQHTGGSTSTLTRTSKKSEVSSSASRPRRHDHIKDDLSTTSASKSALSSQLRNGDARRKVK